MESTENTTGRVPPAPPADGGKPTIRLDDFEGPLDLLLELIGKKEFDIFTIPIVRITEQYLEYLEVMKDLNINVAGEWVVMASRLVYIKSRALLPPEPATEEDDEGGDPLKELVYDLLEHQKFKNAAEMLYTREEVENAVWNKPPAEVVEDAEEVVTVTLFDLLRAFNEVVKRFEAQRTMEIDQEEVTVEQKIAYIRHLLLVRDTILFSALFAEARTKRHLIATFMALLDLVKDLEVRVFQEQAFGEIKISKRRRGEREAKWTKDATGAKEAD
ncbi:MAG: segregation/condensation protein A [Acidobacteriota bacterium]|jgi:segregation and condensation protein A|nr:segregation/condensation protein A [Acidobacteriota bacterium]